MRPLPLLPCAVAATLLLVPDAPAQDATREGTFEAEPILLGDAPLPDPGPDGPWRLQTALGLPAWLTLRGQQRTRYEHLDHQFRKGTSGSAELWSIRTDLEAVARAGEFSLTLEGMDGRQLGAADNVLLSTGIVNAMELVQVHVGYGTDGVLQAGDRFEAKLGRFTQDLGSRRFLARNRYRNTVNTFDGAHVSWQDDAGTQLQAFYTLPVRRLPFSQASLQDNDVEFDETRTEAAFWGVHATLPNLAGDGVGELFALRLDEHDGVDYPTRNRQLWTLGARWNQGPRPGRWHGEVEGAFQFGESRLLSAASDFQDLDHEAWFVHLGLGYTFDHAWRWRVEGLFDHATGDDDPNDGRNGRFDTLFGIPRPEFGPTSVYGPFQRANVLSPGYRVSCTPVRGTSLLWLHRLVYLAQATDSWVGTGLQDPTGSSGDELGQLVELRLRHDVVPESVMFELGLAHHFVGSYVDTVPDAPHRGDTTFLYTGVHLRF